MEYIFGKSTRRHKDCLTLKTKGTIHTDLEGLFEHREVYPDCVIVTSCEIVSHYHSTEDAEGNCYDWYEIDHYEQKVDLADAARDALQEEIDGLIADCGELVEQLYESDMEYIIGE